MASVTLNEIWLHDYSDHSTFHKFGLYDISLDSERDERILVMANGRQVSVTKKGTRRSWSVVLMFVARSEVEWLEDQAGVPFMVRTPHGELFYATLNDVKKHEVKLPGTVHDTKVGSASFTLKEVTHE